MNKGSVVFAAAAVGLATGMAVAAEVAPGDIKFQDNMVAMALTDSPGNAEEGAKVFKNTSQGNCLACHANPAMSNELFHGNVGPSLDGVAERWKPEELRAIVANSKAVFGGETVMPGFYSLEVGLNVREDLVGKTILSAQQVEDVVAYLMTLK